MNNNTYAEYTEIAGSLIQIFAMQLDSNKLVWSISSNTHGISIQINDNTENAVQSLKDLHRAIDGAINFLDVKQKEVNDE